jgi:hypothetical protein
MKGDGSGAKVTLLDDLGTLAGTAQFDRRLAGASAFATILAPRP